MDSNCLPTWKQRRSRQSFVCIHHVASLCQIHKVSAQVGFSEPGKLKGCSSNAAACCGRTALALKCSCTLVSSQTIPPCLQTWHPRSEPSARKLSPDMGKKGCSKLAPGTNQASFGGPKTGSSFLHDLNCWATWWTQFWVQISTPEMGPQNAKKGTSLLFEGFRCGALPGVKFCAVYPNELATALPSG